MFSLTQILGHTSRQITRRDIAIALGLIFCYLCTRLYALLSLPIFVDEGIYIHWARIATHDPNWRLISLLDGKQPLQTWLTIPFIKLFPTQLLLAGRLVAVLTGLWGMSACMAWCGYLWGKRAWIIAGCLYICTPYFLFYDRLALIDSAVLASAWSIGFVCTLLAQTRRASVALLAGVISGVGLLAKSSVLLFVGLGWIVSIGYEEGESYMKRFQKWIQNIHRLADILFLYTVMVGVALGLYMVQKFFSPFFHNIAQKNLTFVLSLTEWLRDPFQLVANNIRIVPLYVVWESGWILALVGVWGIYRMLRAREPVGLLLLAYLVIPFVLVVFFNKVVYPRYLIFFAGFLMMGAVYVLSTAPSWIRQKATVGICLLLFVQCIPQWFAVNSISLPPVDRGQYIEGSSAVWGADDLMDQVRLATKDGKRATVLAEGDFGLIADVLEVFKRPDDIIDIRGKWPLNEVHIREVQREVGKTHAFVVFSHRKDFPVHWEQELIHLVKVYTKPGTSGEKVYLFRILPSSPKL